MLKTFQLKAARSVTGIEVREIGLYLGISRTIVSRWERQEPHEKIRSNKVQPERLIFFFQQHKISFPDERSLSLMLDKPVKTKHMNRFQLRAARSCLGLTQDELAKEIGVSRSLINYLETQKNEVFLNQTKKAVSDLEIKGFFESKNILFPNSNIVTFKN